VTIPKAQVLRGRGCDDEVAGIMEELSRLQTWMTILTCQMRSDATPRAAIDLIQRTRCLIVERCFDRPKTAIHPAHVAITQ
jgi:hypothetical protein